MASSILRLRTAAAAGGCRQFASSAVGLMVSSNKMYSLGEKKVVNINNSNEEYSEVESVIGSSHGWVGLMKNENKCRRSSSLSLWNPMSGSRLKLPPLPGRRMCEQKLVVDDGECSRAISCECLTSWLSVCCPNQCSEWTPFGSDTQYDDVVACSGNIVYTVDFREELVKWNISDPRRPRMEWNKCLFEVGYNDDEDEKKNFPRKSYPLCYTHQHLVYEEHSGQLFIVSRHSLEKMDPHGAEVDEPDLWNSRIHPNKTVGFDVHLLVQNGKGKLKAVRYMEHSLDGLVMFVGINNSFAVSAADFPHLKPDSIYFTDQPNLIPPQWDVDEIYGGHDIGIYDYKNRTISSCYYPTHHHSLKRINPHPFWFTPTSTTTTLKG